MGQSAYIRFVKGSKTASMTLDELKEELQHYRDEMAKTGAQLGWDYADAAFPYTVETKPEGEGKWFYLKGKNDLYKYIVFGVDSVSEKTGTEDGAEEENQVHFIQVVLPEGCTHGDKSKANELCKFLGSRLKAQLQLFNGRMIHYNLGK